MNGYEIMETNDFKRCADFHGHICPGLAIGYRVSTAALEWLEENKAPDEEIVAIVENNACCVDAVQVLTGCTFGKGNFLFRDYGKMAFNFYSRKTGKGIRIYMHSKPEDNSNDLFEKIRNNEATDVEINTYMDLKLKGAISILESPFEDLFTMKPATFDMPDKAKIERSLPCSVCGEMVMASKLVDDTCRGCIENEVIA